MKNENEKNVHMKDDFKAHKKRFSLIFILLAFIGAIFLWHSWSSSIVATKTHEMALAKASESSLSKENIKLLRGVPEDLNSAAYKAIKDNLVALAANENGIRFVYLLAQRDGKIYIMADSEPADSKDYSPPGQEYTEADEQFFLPFKTGEALVTSKVTDRWGSWISVMVPVKDTKTGELIALLGLDYPLNIWYKSAVINVAQTSAIIIAAFLTAIIFYILVLNNLKLKKNQEDLQNANAEVIRSEKNYKHLISKMQQAFAYHEIICDESGKPINYRFLSVNESFEKLLGLKTEQIIGKTVFEVMPGVENNWIDTYGKVALTGEPVEFCSYSAELNKYFSISAYSPQLKTFAVIANDISEDKKIEDDLRKSEEKYRYIFEFSPLGVFTFNLQGIIIDCNDLFVDIIGSSREKLIGLNMVNLPDLKVAECVRGALQGNFTEYRDTYHSVTSDKITPLRGKFSPIYSQTNEIIGGTGVIEDITERQKIQDELHLKSMVLDQLEEHITISDLNGSVNYINQAQLDVLRFSTQEVFALSNDLYSRIPTIGTYKSEILEKTLRDGFWQGELMNYNPDGSELIMDCRTQIICNDDGEPIALAGIAKNITERKTMEKELNNEKELFKTTLLSVGDGVISTDNQGYVVFINKVAEVLTGWSAQEACGKLLDDVFNITDETTGKKSMNPVFEVLATKKIFELSNHTLLISKDGSGRYIEDSAAPIQDMQGNITGVVLVFRDFTDRRMKQKEVEYLSFHDQLTGLYNRRYYEMEVKRLDNDRYYPITLAMADVNGLKLTNDAFGHDVGDLLLQRIAHILKTECRAQDIVARIGGDEFVLLLPETDANNANIVLNRINSVISKAQINDISLSISIGYAVKEDDSFNMNELFMKAEDSMYRHKLSESSSARSKTIDLVLSSLFAKSEREMSHSSRVGDLCESIAVAMGYAKIDVEQIRLAGLMHDIGKIGISETLLEKPAKLDEAEKLEFERHAEIGYRMLSAVSEFSKIADYILEHHERPDGKGYPRGLTEKDISKQARIIAVADAYDAMTAERPYRKVLTQQEAAAEIIKYAGTQFDPKTARTLVEKVLGEKWI